LTVSAACNDTIFDDPSRVASFKMNPTSLEFTAWGEAEVLTATALDHDGQPFEAAITWTSSNPAVASVDGLGIVRSVANGSATIRAEMAGFTTQASVTVDAAGPYNLEFVFVTPFSAGRMSALRAVERRIETVIRDELTDLAGRVCFAWLEQAAGGLAQLDQLARRNIQKQVALEAWALGLRQISARERLATAEPALAR